jgi:ferritin
MLEPDVEKALNMQIAWELTASQEYLALAAQFEAMNLKGFAKYMRRQSEEEREHALRLFDHICARGGRVRLQAVPQPRIEFDSTRAIFQAAYDREQANTRSINELYQLALQENDFATQTMLRWFIEEQVEEEAWCQEALGLLERIGDDRGAMLVLDRRYGEKADEGAG